MSKPEIENEIIIECFDATYALCVDIATHRALDWFRREVKLYASSISHAEIPSTLPASFRIQVSRCYVLDEVKQYLEHPVYMEGTVPLEPNDPVSIVKFKVDRAGRECFKA